MNLEWTGLPIEVSVATAAFLGTMFLVAVVFSMVKDLKESDWMRVKQRVSDEFSSQHERKKAASAKILKQLREASSESLDGTTAVSARDRLDILIEQSGLTITPAKLLLRSCLLAVGCGFLGMVLTRSPLIGAMFALVGATPPLILVMLTRRRRLKRLRRQLGDALAMMARVLRAGQTTSQAMQIISHEFDDPVAGEFNCCYEEQNLGLDSESALRNLARRTGILEIRMFVVATIVHRQTGGNLGELLDSLSKVIRERFQTQGLIQSITAEGRFQGAILLALPIVIWLIILPINPEYALLLFDYKGLLLAGFVAECLGALWIHRIVSFDF